jgi:gamma-tubulin complex component 3
MMNEMQHFIKNLYSYVMLEAVESPWKKFLDECERIKDLDSLIKLHE